MRFGWGEIPLADIRSGNWKSIKRRLTAEHKHKGTVTTDTNRLRDLATTTPDDVWITFHDSLLWWGRPKPGPIQEDSISKYRDLLNGWSHVDAAGKSLTVNRIPGIISQVQGFRGTVCSVRHIDVLRRVINAQFSDAHRLLEASRQQVIQDLQSAIRSLHWKDFELLVDLTFRQAGWRRRSMLGKAMKFVDLELIEPVTGAAYQVQVKSKASVRDFERYAEDFSSAGFQRLFFVVHTPSTELCAYASEYEGVDLVLPERLAALVADGGLVEWVLERVH